MRLVEFDDYPFHQVPTPFSVSGTSDVHFNDGYWFSAYADGWYLATGLRLHPNTNVMDCFASVAREGEQTAVRASRVLRPELTDLRVGPMQVEILEPMRRIRVSLSDAPVDLGFALEFEGLDEPLLETPYEHRKFGHLINHLVRYTQICRASGWIRHDGQEQPVDGWHAMRDHSWGLRSTMGPRTPHGGVDPDEAEVDHRRFRLWVPFQTTAHTGFFHLHEAGRGETLDFEGRLTDTERRSVHLVACPGTRWSTARAHGTCRGESSRSPTRTERSTSSQSRRAVPPRTFRASGTTAAGTTAAAPASGAASGRSWSTIAIPSGPTYHCQAHRTSR